MLTFAFNFITAHAWIWGSLMLIGLVLCVATRDTDMGAEAFLYGILAWVWLIARYAP